MPARLQVAVIGGGVSGILAVKACLEEGIDPICFEQGDQIGGTWYYTSEVRTNSGVSIYDSLVVNTSKPMTSLSDFPLPDDSAMYPRHQEVHSYLLRYAENFQLRPHIVLNTRVVDIRKLDGQDGESAKWEISVEYKDQSITCHKFDAVMLCSGFYRGPYIPQIPGLDEFEGLVMHSREFRNGLRFRNKRVLVVGNANSAGDIAVDVSNVADQVYLSIGRGVWVGSRLVNGRTPIDLALSRFGTYVPEFVKNFVVKRYLNSVIDHDSFGLTPPKPPLNFPLMLSSDMPLRLISGKIKIVPFVTSCYKNGVELENELYINDLDAIIFATGFERDFDLLSCVHETGKLSTDDDLELFKQIFPIHASRPTAAVIGCLRANGPIFPQFELQTRLAVKVFTKKIKLPSQNEMHDDVVRWKKKLVSLYGKLVFRVPYPEFSDEVADLLGVKPRFWKLFWRSPRLAFQCFFGPAYPAQYRLLGPDSSKDARIICQRYSKTLYDGVRCENKRNRNSSQINYIASILILSITVNCYYLVCILMPYERPLRQRSG